MPGFFLVQYEDTYIPLAFQFVDSYFTDVKIINAVMFALLPNYLIENTFGIDTANKIKIFCSTVE